MQDFSSLGLPEQLLNSLKLLQFSTPTPIQAKVIPDALKGKDILGSAQTGSGKTAAFGIPLVAKLMLNPKGSALVMTPTRELAVQVIKMLESLIGKNTNIKTALLIGGESITKQFQKLRAKPRLIVGTPGRINDHIMRDTVKLSDVEFLVLDETDRMLDMGFTPQIDSILELIPKERQTLLFSATLPKNIMSMSKKYLTDPLRVSLEDIAKPVSTLKQETINVSEQDKYSKLLEELESREGSIIIFIKTKMAVDRITKRLRQDDHSADALHGDLSHNRRERAISGFRMCKYRILVATDIAARGLDIAHVRHVINYDLPQCPEDYIHRIGRTARAGAEGSALCLISPADKGKWQIISNLINFGESPPEQEMGNRKASNRSFGNKPFGNRSSDGRNSNARSSDGRNFGNKSFGNSSFGNRGFRDDREANSSGGNDQRKRFSFSSERNSSERNGNERNSEGRREAFRNTDGFLRPERPFRGASRNLDRNSEGRGESFRPVDGEQKQFGNYKPRSFKSPDGEQKQFGNYQKPRSFGSPSAGPQRPFNGSDGRKKLFRRTNSAA